LEPTERFYFAVDICQRVTPRAFLLLEQSVEPTDDGAARTGCTGRAMSFNGCYGELTPPVSFGHSQVAKPVHERKC